MSFRKLIAIGLFALWTGVSSHAAEASPVLDQDNFTDGFVSYCTGPTCHWYQTVYAGVDGTLAGVDLRASGGHLFIYSGTAGALGSLLSGFSLQTIGYGASQYVDTSLANIALTAGQSFVLDVFAYDFLGGNVAPYGGSYNNLWLQYGSNPAYNYGNFSLGFRTYMEGGDPVPAPGALAVLGLGLIGFGALRRKKLAA